MKNKFRGLTLVQLIVVICFIFLLIIGLIAPVVIDRATKDTIIVTVNDKDVKRKDDNTDKYLIYTDKGTYEITDSVAYWRWDSSDLYGEIKIGNTYEITVCGYRIPILSEYKNILEVKEITE